MSTGVQEQTGTLGTALAHAARLLATNPALAAAQAEEILKLIPSEPRARLTLGAARRLQGDASAACAILEPLAAAQPKVADIAFHLGQTYAALGRTADAMNELRRAVRLAPDHGGAWRALGDLHTLAEETAAADMAYAEALRASVRDPRLMEAARALCDNDIPVAERLTRDHLKANPTDVAAIRMLAEIAARLGRYEDAEKLLTRALELAPSFTAARHNIALVLHRQGKSAAALPHLEMLLAVEPTNPAIRNLKAAALTRLGDYDEAIALYRDVLRDQPTQHRVWLSLGHALKTSGRSEESIAAYEKSADIAPSFGEAYWSLANMKTFSFTEATVAQMRAQLEAKDLTNEDRYHLHYALGKALEDAKNYEPSFHHYAEGARLRRDALPYSADETSRFVQNAKALFTPAFFAERKNQGAPAPDPIFIVGLPRAGSTLIEQILSSHSQIEGTMELPDMLNVAKAIGGARQGGYLEKLAALTPAQLRAYGEDYLAATRIQRKTNKPFFIDKLPNNFLHTGLIQLILPNAKIIDARRHPLGNCFSAFKQHFARGHAFSYDLTDLGRYYADYVSLMAHFDRATPGAVHRVIYEEMVADTEAQVRALLAYCGVPFEEACLAFHANDRAVRTASSEQVRQPIYTDAVAHWRNYEPWLEPLKTALGPTLSSYPAPPAD